MMRKQNPAQSFLKVALPGLCLMQFQYFLELYILKHQYVIFFSSRSEMTNFASTQGNG
jgi:hypothetical protein